MLIKVELVVNKIIGSNDLQVKFLVSHPCWNTSLICSKLIEDNYRQWCHVISQ